MDERIEYDIKVNIDPPTGKHYAMVGMDDLLRILRVFEYQRGRVGLFPEETELHKKLIRIYRDAKRGVEDGEDT